MPFVRPTLAALVERIKGDFIGRLSLLGPLLRRAVAEITSIVWAGAAHEMHGHIEWLSLQMFATTAEPQYLLLLGGMYIGGLIPATYASGLVNATGVDGSVIAEGTIWVRSDGITYRTTADTTIASGVAEVPVEAVLAGSDGNLDEGESVSLESPVTGVDSGGEVGTDGIAGGFDEEDIEAYRARLLHHLIEPPEGGSDQDYEEWALEVAGVTRAWVFRHENGLGTVVVRFMMDGELDPFPSPTAVAAVQAKLDSERPTTAEVTAAAPVELLVDVTLAVSPNTTAVHDAVTAELADLLLREGAPGDGAGKGTIKLSHILTAVGVAEGIDDFSLTVPGGDVVPALGELARLGTVTFT